MERRPEAKGELSDETDNDLQMAPELMLELAHKAAEFFGSENRDLARRKCLGWRVPGGTGKTTLERSARRWAVPNGKFSLRLCIANHTTAWPGTMCARPLRLPSDSGERH